MKKLTQLTDEQKMRISSWVEEYIAIGLCTDEADWGNAEKGIRACYEFANIPMPKTIIHVQSPIVGAIAAPVIANILQNKLAVDSAVYSAVNSAVYSTVYSAVDSAVDSAVNSAVYSTVRSAVYSAVDSAVDSAVNSAVESEVRSAVYSAVDSAVKSVNKKIWWHNWFGGQFWISDHAYEGFFRKICKIDLPPDIIARAEAYELAQTSCNYWWTNKNFVIICNRPKTIKRNARGQLHCIDGKAIEYRDGWGLYSLNGVTVSEKLVMTPADKLDPKMVLKEKNAEVRREIVRKIGIDRIISALDAKTIDTWAMTPKNVYELVEFKMPHSEVIAKYLKMPDIHGQKILMGEEIGQWQGTYRFEGVAPHIKTVKEALDWRISGIWKPKQLT